METLQRHAAAETDKPKKKKRSNAAKPRLTELAYLRQRVQSVDDAESRRGQSTLKVPLPIGSHSREPAEAPLGSERHHSTRTPRGTFAGETVVAQKPALGTAKTAGQGVPCTLGLMLNGG